MCYFTTSTPVCKNFVEGERTLHAGHLLFCGKEESDQLSEVAVGIDSFT